MRRAALASLALAALACATPPRVDREAAKRDIDRELDDLHDAAAHSDGARYFAHYTPGATFLGTDATERWDLGAFHAYADPKFSAHKGWVYTKRRRAIDLSPEGTVAWFDEDLDNKHGPARGSGVLVYERGRWLVAQYNLAVTVPNARFDAVAAAIDGGAPSPR
jgi:hypothetical protein